MQENCSKMRFIPGVRIKEIIDGKLMVFSNGDNYCIPDPSYIEILKFLEEKGCPLFLHEIQSKLDILGMAISPERLQEITQNLVNFAIVTFQDSNLPNHIQSFLSKIGVSPQVAEEKLKSQKVTVYSYSNCPANQLEESLQHLNVQTGEDGTIYILLVDDYLNSHIHDFHQKARQSKLPWMLVKPDGLSFWVGPLFNYNQSPFPSYESLAWRLKENRFAEIDAFGIDSTHFSLPSLTSLPNARAVSLNIAALEIFKWIVSGSSDLLLNILSYDCKDLSIGFHYVDIHPFERKSLLKKQNDEQAKSLKLALNPSIKTFFDEEGARTRSPEETLKSIEHLISPITGLLSKMHYKKQNDYHIYYGPRCHNLTDGTTLGHIRPAEVVLGKSKTMVNAKVGCIAEGIERYYSANYKLHDQHYYSYREIADKAVHPQVLLNFSPRQYAQSEITNPKWGPFQWVGLPFDENEKIHWLQLTSLNSGKESFIPSSFCYIRQNTHQEQLMCMGDSNGCACGNSLEEALFYGLSEVIERDAVAIWWYNRLTRPTVDLDSFSNPSITNLVRSIKAQGRCLRVVDITTDINVPAFVAISWKIDGSRIVFGSAAHLNPQIGIVRALSELCQILTRANIPDTIDFSNISASEKEVIYWMICVNIKDIPFLAQEKGKRLLEDYPKSIENLDFLDDLNIYFSRLQDRSLDIYALNLTPINSPLAVVKAIVPQMRHFWARLGEGRLYQVPVLLGDLTEPLKEDQLNPIPYFL